MIAHGARVYVRSCSTSPGRTSAGSPSQPGSSSPAQGGTKARHAAFAKARGGKAITHSQGLAPSSATANTRACTPGPHKPYNASTTTARGTGQGSQHATQLAKPSRCPDHPTRPRRKIIRHGERAQVELTPQLWHVYGGDFVGSCHAAQNNKKKRVMASADLNGRQQRPLATTRRRRPPANHAKRGVATAVHRRITARQRVGCPKARTLTQYDPGQSASVLQNASVTDADSRARATTRTTADERIAS